MRRGLSKHRLEALAIVGLMVAASTIGLYILAHQRARLPWATPQTHFRVAFTTAQAVVPGQGQTVRVAGVDVGDVTGNELQNGHAVVEIAIDDEYKGMVRTNATALLRPRTPLKDMFVELDPGSRDAPPAHEGFTIPISNTLPDVNPDEFLAALDTDTRQYLKLFLKGAGDGLRKRGSDLREVLKRFEPTHRDLALVASASARRQRELRRLITSLHEVFSAIATKDDDLTQLVDTASRSFGTLANRHDQVSETVRLLPGTLGQATRALDRLEGMAHELGPAAAQLQVVPPALVRSNHALRPFAQEAVPLLRRDIRPFVRAAQPSVAQLAKSGPSLAESDPGLSRSFKVLNRFFNMAGHNPRGREPASKPGRDEGYLFHAAWSNHQLVNVLSFADAHGSMRKVVSGARCSDLRGITRSNPLAELGLGLTPILTDPRLCGGKR